jgi:hypothetical protein
MSERTLRDQLVTMLQAPNAHPTLDGILDDFPIEHRGEKPEGFTHSAWELLEHLRMAQEDILRFSTDPKYESPEWPEGYWPEKSQPEGSSDWSRSIETFQADLRRMIDLVENPASKLDEPFAHGNGQTLLRECILLIKHNSYHFGQLMMLRRYFENR